MLLRSEVLPLQPDVLVEAFGYHDGNGALCHDHEVLTDSLALWRTRTVLYQSRVFLLLRTLMLRRQANLNDAAAEKDRVQRVPPKQFKRNLQTLLDLGQKHSFRVVFLLEPLRDPQDWQRTRWHMAAARELARERDILLIDGFEAFARMSQPDREACFDDAIHLNQAGHKILAELVRDDLRQAGILVSAGPRTSPPVPSSLP